MFNTLKIPDSSITTRQFSLNLTRTDLAPDGYTRVVWTSNGKYPGPIIQANKGDRVIINVSNHLVDPTTIHWHGMFQISTNWYDGVAGQTQCPIPDGISFVYNFSTGDQTGTYWWHSHYLSQYIDGLRGALIIHDPSDPYLKDYDYEYVVTLSDWYHSVSSELLAKRLAPGYRGRNPIPDAGLISGRGQYNCSAASSDAKCNSTSSQPIYKVVKDKKYRLRLINTSAQTYFFFSIDNHQMTLIEADGINIQSQKISKLPIHVGQRYSVIINADQEVANYYIRATMVQCEFPPNSSTSDAETINYNSSINYNVTGILRYDGASETSLPTSQEWNDDFATKLVNCRDLNDSYLIPLESSIPPNVTDRLVFNVTVFPDSTDNVTKAYINNSSFTPDLTSPSLNQILSGTDPATFATNLNSYTYDTKDGCVQITVINSNLVEHPFHLHGHTFWLIGSGLGIDGVVNETAFNLVNPPVLIRYKINNPGIWSFHCHIEWHLGMGMSAQLVELRQEFQNLTLPAESKALCEEYENSQKRSIPGLAGDRYGLLLKGKSRNI
ncbi:5991_t:CDS:2, partial [Diversispora eburnea]